MNGLNNNFKIHLPLGSNSYDIFIGDNIDTSLLNFLKESKFSKQCLIISDENVAKLYGQHYIDLIEEAGFKPRIIALPAGEENKSLKVAEAIYTIAIEHNLDRKSPIFALGGGVIGDLAGFVAATFMRGVPFIQLPTSLLAQVDSSVGGKVAVNHALGKNLIGAFYQPKAVFIDVNTLTTLPKREISTGLGEIIKYAYIYDANLLRFLQANGEKVQDVNIEVMKKIIYRCCQIKGEVVAQDEKESNLRAILNFGHTLAHAIETETNYKVYNHGEAVAIGMLAAAHISLAMGKIHEEIIKTMEELLLNYGLPLRAEGLDPDNLYKHLFHDKKTVAGKINWVLLDQVGKVYIDKDVKESIVRDAIQKIV